MQVVISKSAQKSYIKLPKSEQAKILRKLETLSKDPFFGKKLRGELIGQWVLRAWPYRIIYSTNQKLKRIEINNIVHRQGAYK